MLADLEGITQLEREGRPSPCSFLTQAFVSVQPVHLPHQPEALIREVVSALLSPHPLNSGLFFFFFLYKTFFFFNVNHF